MVRTFFMPSTSFNQSYPIFNYPINTCSSNQKIEYFYKDRKYSI
jgi:hypothetical protein